MSVSDDAGAEFREVGHRLIDLLADYLDGIEELDVFPDAAPAELESLFSEPLPPGGMGDRAGIGGDGAAGGSLAVRPGRLRRSRGRDPDERRHDGQLIGLKLARDAVSGDRAQHEGVVGGWAVYTSDERHVAIDKAVDAVGLGRQSLRVVATDDAFRIDLAALEEAIERDRAAGVRALCLVAMGGSTNAGSRTPWRSIRTSGSSPRSTGLDEETLARLHAEVVRSVEQGGRFWITTTRLKGRPWFRVNPVNFRTRLEHMDQLFELLRAECRRAASRLRTGHA